MHKKLTVLACLALFCGASVASAAPLYRLYISGDHFYTTNLEEAFNATRLGYVFEGNVGECELTATLGTTPLYRLYSSNSEGGDHFYTTSSQERDLAIAAHGYRSEGIACWARPSQAQGTCPLYRTYHNGVQDHFYTLSWKEVLSAAGMGYAHEGVAAYMGVSGSCPD